MKSKLTFFLTTTIVFVIFSQAVFAQKLDKAIDYMEYIGKEFKAIQNDTWDYTSSFSHNKKARTIEAKRKELVKQITNSHAKIKKMPDFKENTSYRDSVVAYLEINLLVINEDYAKLVDMEEVAEQSYDFMEAYLLAKEKASDKLAAASDRLDIEYRKFASNNNINIVESNDKISKMLEEAGKVYKYYNEIYLIFFKSYKQEMFMVDAQNIANINSMEQNRSALSANSTEGLKKFTALKAYKSDNSLIASCVDLLKFYQDEANNKFKAISDYYVAKEKFEKLQAAFDAKGSNKSKQDVDQFNNSSKEFNTVLEKYNKTNQEINQKRSALFAKWNNTTASFTDRHVPKKK